MKKIKNKKRGEGGEGRKKENFRCFWLWCNLSCFTFSILRMMMTRMMINTQQEKIEHFNFCFCNLTRRKLRLKNTTTVPSNGILNYMVLATAKNKQHEYDVIFIPSPARL